MDSEQEQEEKQLFLRTEILDQNYSAQDFTIKLNLNQNYYFNIFIYIIK
jgi:hypothetical protein